ncbi:hypothetical protein BKA59DRAFT_460462 [Fusarium tricinctum]|uniref:Uncharacterized protein n=1 Tax=Fusarium tricinctum TaxID=61284 RepID=A0A8K0W6X8_9HYPO|nr:hypothetical protein BKA59DRAFT_460462 [Fusarium tricinctum]
MHLSSFLIIAAFSLVCGQAVSPYPVSDCGGLAGAELQLSNPPGCCSGGAKCCDVSDKSLCGAAVTHLSQGCPAAAGIHPSKLCVGVDSDWYCPWDAVCNNAGGGCFGGRYKRDNCDGQATEAATETAADVAADTDTISFTTDFATTTESSAPTTLVDASASHSETETSLATSINSLSTDFS